MPPPPSPGAHPSITGWTVHWCSGWCLGEGRLLLLRRHLHPWRVGGTPHARRHDRGRRVVEQPTPPVLEVLEAGRHTVWHRRHGIGALGLARQLAMARTGCSSRWPAWPESHVHTPCTTTRRPSAGTAATGPGRERVVVSLRRRPGDRGGSRRGEHQPGASRRRSRLDEAQNTLPTNGIQPSVAWQISVADGPGEPGSLPDKMSRNGASIAVQTAKMREPSASQCSTGSGIVTAAAGRLGDTLQLVEVGLALLVGVAGRGRAAAVVGEVPHHAIAVDRALGRRLTGDESGQPPGPTSIKSPCGACLATCRKMMCWLTLATA